MALILRPFVFGDAKVTATAPMNVEVKQQQVISLVKKMEKAHMMFNYAVVASITGDTVTHMNLFVEEEFLACIKYHTVAEMKDLVGFNSFTGIDIPLWTRGYYDVSKGAVHSPHPPTSPPTSIVPTTTVIMDDVVPTTTVIMDGVVPTTTVMMDDVDTAVSAAETAVELFVNISPKNCAALLSATATTEEDGFPNISLIPKMTGDVLRAWLKKCGVTAPSDDCRVQALKDLLLNHITLHRHHGLRISTSIPTDEEKRTWGMKVCTAHDIIAKTPWKSCLTAEASEIPSLSQKVIDEYCDKINVCSTRVK